MITFKNNKCAEKSALITFNDIVSTAKTLKNETETIRAEKSQKKRQDLKLSMLPCFWVAEFKTDNPENNSFKQSQYLMFDIDKLVS